MSDTHSYDSKLNIDNIQQLLQIKDTDLEEKRKRGNDILRFIHDPIARNFMTSIINDMGTANNIDGINRSKIDESYKLCTDDLVYILWQFRENRDFIMLLEEQLIHMQTGFCPQGRTHRLYQLLMAFLKSE